jgi:hypothetical protein
MLAFIFGPKYNNKYTKNNYEVERIWAKVMNRLMCITLTLKATCEGVN